MTQEYVSNDEELYRNVRPEEEAREYYYHSTSGHLIITSQAFLDRKQEPSVDRTKLKDFDPRNSLLNENNGIVSLITEEVRQVKEVKSDAEDGTEIVHIVDVIWDPNPEEDPDNDAHSRITVEPKYLTSDRRGKAFKLLRRALGRLATRRGWTLEPSSS